VSERLNHGQIAILRNLLRRGGAVRAVSLDARARRPILPLWRRGIIEIWYRRAPDSYQCPFYGLTVSGALLASCFVSPEGL
jgi:hypothetical protein